MAVSKRLRYEILRRDNNTCWYCKTSDGPLTIDHVVPVALGGTDDPSNLVAACKDCNAGKSASNPDAPLVAAVDEEAARFTVALNQVIEQRAAQSKDDDRLLRWFDGVWREWTTVPVERDADWESSILRFRSAGVSREYMQRAVNTAMSNRTVNTSKVWRYFCGICWNEVKAIQDAAAKQLRGREQAPPPADAHTWHFPYMEMFDAFLDDLVHQLGGNDRIRKVADDALWSAMPKAHSTWMETRHSEDDLGMAETLETFTSVIARSMYEIGQIRKSGGAWDGS